MLSRGSSRTASSLQRAMLPALFTHRASAIFSSGHLGLPRRKFSSVVRSRGKTKGTSWRWNCGLLFAPRALGPNADALTDGSVKMRDIVEHIFLLKANSDLSEDEEKDMLDHLYTSQYQMRGILAISLGNITDTNVDGFTHAVFMRFQKKEDLAKFYGNSYYEGVLKEHVTPYCYGSVSVDYESEVKDDIMQIFRRGEDFNYGAEFVLLFSFSEDAAHSSVKGALTTLQALIDDFDSLIIQATLGSNFNQESEYTHGAVLRFPSRESLEIFRGCSEYNDMWRLKLRPILRKASALHFTVDPVGSELM